MEHRPVGAWIQVHRSNISPRGRGTKYADQNNKGKTLQIISIEKPKIQVESQK